MSDSRTPHIQREDRDREQREHHDIDTNPGGQAGPGHRRQPGIGAAIVRRLASQGATVAVNYRSDRAAADALVGELTDQGWAASAFPGDVSDAAQTHELVGAVVSEFGGLDLLVSNAGVEHFGALETITQADFDLLFQTNVAGQLFVTQAAVAAMTDGGRIVLSSSVSVRLAVHHHALYAASKAAISAMVRNLAPELAERNIAINAIAPGATATRMATRYAATTPTRHWPTSPSTRSSVP